ncbi:MADS-box transcription factor 58-like [Nicotiana tabacum]|uniref:MADS-box transcription factor 58-like n=1 Tax=Nicotiana tabacum TaxID=4097 RepID=A0AC58TNS8_TOBAC
MRIKATIDQYKKATSETSNACTTQELNAQFYQQESKKLLQQIQMIQNSNRHLVGEGLSSLNVRELKQLENRLERGITRIRFLNMSVISLRGIQEANKLVGSNFDDWTARYQLSKGLFGSKLIGNSPVGPYVNHMIDLIEELEKLGYKLGKELSQDLIL